VKRKLKPLWAIKARHEMDIRGISQTQLSKILDIPITPLNLCLKGKRNTPEHINKICKFLEIER
jgi:DNA-binding Xre family transcriptional regulator